MAKKLSIGLNIVLLIAVGHLYYLNFQGGEEETGPRKVEGEEGSSGREKEPMGAGEARSGSENLRIAYVKGDSILNNYDFLEEKYEELNDEQIRLEQKLRQKVEKYKQKAQQFKEEQAYMTAEELKQKRQELLAYQEEIQKDRQRLTNDLRKKEQKMQKKLFRNLNDFLEDYNTDREYDYILNYQQGGQVLFCNDAYNITQQVLQGLNEQYTEERDTAAQSS